VWFDLDDEIEHPLCHHLSKHGAKTPDCLASLIPRRFQSHRVLNLKPWTENPLPPQRQEEMIAKIPSCADNLHGWLLAGEGGTSKATYAAAAFTDMVTIRAFKNPEAESLCCYAISLPGWLAETEKYKYRNYGFFRTFDAGRRLDMVARRGA
jgi:hypothetical protein